METSDPRAWHHGGLIRGAAYPVGDSIELRSWSLISLQQHPKPLERRLRRQLQRIVYQRSGHDSTNRSVYQLHSFTHTAEWLRIVERIEQRLFWI